MSLFSTRAIWRCIGVTASIAAAATVTATVALALDPRGKPGSIRVDVYLGQKHVGVVAGGDVVWIPGRNKCEMIVDDGNGGGSGKLFASESLGGANDEMRRVSAARWDYYHSNGVTTNSRPYPVFKRSGYALRVNRSTWNVFTTSSPSVSRKIGYVHVAIRRGALPFYIRESGPAGALILLMKWWQLDCLQ